MFGKNGKQWPKSSKNRQIGHQAGNFECISLAEGRFHVLQQGNDSFGSNVPRLQLEPFSGL